MLPEAKTTLQYVLALDPETEFANQARLILSKLR